MALLSPMNLCLPRPELSLRALDIARSFRGPAGAVLRFAIVWCALFHAVKRPSVSRFTASQNPPFNLRLPCRTLNVLRGWLFTHGNTLVSNAYVLRRQSRESLRRLILVSRLPVSGVTPCYQAVTYGVHIHIHTTGESAKTHRIPTVHSYIDDDRYTMPRRIDPDPYADIITEPWHLGSAVCSD